MASPQSVHINPVHIHSDVETRKAPAIRLLSIPVTGTRLYTQMHIFAKIILKFLGIISFHKYI